MQLGPLRPNRAVGQLEDLLGVQGVIHTEMRQLPEHWYNNTESKRLREKVPEYVTRHQWPIVEGDRVVIVRGAHVNTIGTVQSLHRDEYFVILQNINTVVRSDPGFWFFLLTKRRPTLMPA